MIGILGGTFDPVHHGHLRTALDVKEALGLQQVRFLPLNQAVHRAQPEASAGQRLAMLRAAVADEPAFVVDESELRRDGPSYMVDTLGLLRQAFPQDPLVLLLGVDAFNGFLGWQSPGEVSRRCHLVLMTRPGYRLAASGPLGDFVASRLTTSIQDLQSSPGGHIYCQSVTPLAISATAIRQKACQGQSLRYLVPPAVMDIIQSRRLYLHE
jgi:nicotinate-nucleotide adenylyltransferase